MSNFASQKSMPAFEKAKGSHDMEMEQQLKHIH